MQSGYPAPIVLLAPIVALAAASAPLSQEADTTREIRWVLERPLDVDVRDMLLAKLPGFLRDRLGVPVVFDDRAVRGDHIKPEATLTCRMRGVAAGVVLRELLRQVDLTYVVGREAIVITASPVANQRMEIQGYAVRDLVGREARYSDLIDQTKSFIAPAAWKERGGAGEMTYELARSQLVVLQSAPVHAELNEYLTRLREARRRFPGGSPQAAAPVSPQPARPAALTRDDVWSRLQQPAGVAVVKQPLGDVLRALEDRLQLSIVSDRGALADEHVTLETPVTLRVDKVTYATALDLLLRPLGLTFVDREGFVWVTSRLKGDNALECEFFPVGDLLDSRGERESLFEMIRATVAPNSWSVVGGSGGIAYDAPGKLLIVSQTRAVQRQITSWLDRFRQARGRAAQQQNAPHAPPTPTGLARRPGEVLTKADVETRLQQPVSVNFAGVALEKAVASVEKQCGVSIVLDRVALEEEVVATDTPVTLHLDRIAAKSALKLLVQELNLACVIGEGHVLITSPLQAGAELETEFYPIADVARSETDVDKVAELIKDTILSNSWSRRGGSGEIGVDSRGRVLAIVQTQAAHQLITDLLAQLRRRPQ